jgi:hypothetical protein
MNDENVARAQMFVARIVPGRSAALWISGDGGASSIPGGRVSGTSTPIRPANAAMAPATIHTHVKSNECNINSAVTGPIAKPPNKASEK